MMTRPLPIAYRSLGVLVGSFFLSASAGCIDPKDDYADFARRPLTEHDAGVADVELTDCDKLLTQDLSGSYYTSCRPRDVPSPFALATNVKVTPDADGGTATLDMSFTPLRTDAKTLNDTAGSLVTLPETKIDSTCAYTENIGTLTLEAAANSLMRDLTATNVVLRGKLQTPTQSCGELDGQVDLIMLSLQGDGDICIFTRIIADAPFPVFMDSDYACDPGGLQPRGPRF
jgi:hypothetical protein